MFCAIRNLFHFSILQYFMSGRHSWKKFKSIVNLRKTTSSKWLICPQWKLQVFFQGQVVGSLNSLRWRNCPTNLWSAVRMPIYSPEGGRFAHGRRAVFFFLPGYIPKMNCWSIIPLMAISFIEILMDCFDSWTFYVPVQLYKPLRPYASSFFFGIW